MGSQVVRNDWATLTFNVFLISVIVLFIADCLFFHSSISLLNSSCNFSIHASSLLICASILFSTLGSSLLSLLWILFQLSCLFPFHLFGLVDFYHVSSSLACFSVFSFCLIYCVWGLLSAGWKVIVTLNLESAACGWDWTSVHEVFLVRGTCACVLVDGGESCLSEGQGQVQ